LVIKHFFDDFFYYPAEITFIDADFFADHWSICWISNSTRPSVREKWTIKIVPFEQVTGAFHFALWCFH